jgi:N-sulfoglucosamine sulfohydrolase
MVEDLHKRGFKVALWVTLWMNMGTKGYLDGNEKGYHTGIIAKVHVQPHEVYAFSEVIPGDGRNGFTLAKKAKEFFASEPDKPFLFVVGFNDPHRSDIGEFGNEYAHPGIKEVIYSPDEVIVSPWLPDNPETRKEIAEYYQAVSRLDQGVGFILKALKETGRDKETMVIYISDGGPPFPGAKTTLYDPGIHTPMIIWLPTLKKRGIVNNAMVSHIDIVPTILDWAGLKPPYEIESPSYSTPERLRIVIPDLPIHKGFYLLPGRSILPILEEENPSGWDTIYASHTFHEITMYYPMRAVRTKGFKYTLNIAHKLDFPFATDLYQSLTWQSILSHNAKMMGVRSVDSYLHRPKEELYDLEKDPFEVNNLAYNPKYKNILDDFRNQLKAFQELTDDVWLLKYRYE